MQGGHCMLKATAKKGNYTYYHLNNSEEWDSFWNKYRSKFEREIPIKNIRNLLVSQNCISVIVEDEYVDIDYRNEFSTLYSKSFKKYEHFSKRLHFFKKKITPETIKSAKSDQQGYLGYIVLRPTLVGRIGRTVICPPFLSGKPDIKMCAARFSSHLEGNEFSVVGSPYIQQDSMVMVCAQSSIWMASRYNSTQNAIFRGTTQHLPHEITENACRNISFWGRPLPSDGLTIHQMVNALVHMDYFPVLYLKADNSDSPWDPIEIVYRYTSSGIPVIITVPCHALTVFGYKEKIQPNCSPEGKNIISRSHWINALIINDDAVGPYRLMPRDESEREKFLNSPEAALLPPGDWCYRSAVDIDGVIVPLPEKIYLLSIHIATIIKGLLKRPFIQNKILQTAIKKDNKDLQEFLECLTIPTKNDPVTFGGFIIPSYKYQEYLRGDSAKRGMSAQVRDIYQEMMLPYYVWVVELSSFSRISKGSTGRTVFGEILLDSTSNKFGPSFIVIHLPGILIKRNPHSENIQIIEIDEEEKAYPEFHH